MFVDSILFLQRYELCSRYGRIYFENFRIKNFKINGCAHCGVDDVSGVELTV
jgi:hypothetical protein